MPITKRQFELGIDDDVQRRMQEIYALLVSDREVAYSFEELFQSFIGDAYMSADRAKLQRALDVLVEIGAVDKRWVTDTAYYAFHLEFNIDSWKRELRSI